MKNKLLILFAFFGFLANSQTHRFIYDVEYKKDSTSTLMTKENWNLDIFVTHSDYYSRDFFVADSLINNNIPFPIDIKLNTSNIISHKKGSQEFEEYDLLENTVLNLKSKDSQNWKLSDEKKVINGLTLQKATTNWGKRNWIAWFAKEIPFQEGPYKFHGLPGLIVELEDDKENYKFSLVKSENYKESQENQFIEMSKKMSVPVTWEKYKSSKLSYYDSPVNFIKNASGSSNNSEFFLNDGTVVNSKNQREINESLRTQLKKFNNPIELDKAIVYPNK
ncbi:GLPGLI family protein [uncultured Chryseobacterium sp.]|uniref:GLPGLI family protein n=1 Tax=uncultured Chryseobacterium sp. TaxID=259322 RepID=UPI002605B5E5|nr:GLPGLI family protein [uncultured Chryseobacterium sp.]